jgi:hypothetical protein
MIMKTLEERRREALKLNRFSPGYGRCRYCQRNWTICEPHSTPYQFTAGIPMRACFPLCEECWQELSIDERLPYYHELWRAWGTRDEDTWHMIEEAVRKGL